MTDASDSFTSPQVLDDQGHPASPDPLIGKLVAGRYEVKEELGQGGMGRVYIAEQVAMKRRVALKVIHAQDVEGAADRTALLKRFEREALATSRLEHHNTVRVFDFGVGEDGNLFLAMELLRGTTLAKILKQGRMEPGRLLHIAIQVCKSLSEAHQKGIIHRDLKPDNIMVFDTEGEKDFVKVLDFGIAKFSSGPVDSSVTKSGMIIGTPAYMAPEQAAATRVGPATDLYSLGVILFEALTGRIPYSAETPLAVLLKHVNAPIPPLVVEGFPPGIPASLEAIVRKLLQKEASARYDSAMEVANALERIAAKLVTVRLVDSDVRVRRQSRRRVWFLAGGAIVLATVLALWLALRPVDGTSGPSGADTTAAVSPVSPPALAEPARAAVPAPSPSPPVDTAAAVPTAKEVPASNDDTSARARPAAPRAAASATTVRARPRTDKPATVALPRCARSKCPIRGDCADESGRRLSGSEFCSDIEF